VGFEGEGQARRRGRPETDDQHASGSTERNRGRSSLPSLLLVLLGVLLLAVLAVAAILLLRSLGDSISGTSVAKDSIDVGWKPRVHLSNAAGRVRVEGVKGLDFVEYEATRYASAADPAAAKRRASEVPVDISREDSTVVVETDGGRETGADYALRVPAGGAVEVESEAGDVEVSGLSGNVTVRAAAGDVRVREGGGGVNVEAPQGDVSLGGVNTDTGGVLLEVGTGDVDLRDMVVGTLEASVEAGNVTLSGRFSGGGRVSVETGNIVARIPSEDTRDLTLETGVGEVLREPPDGSSGAGRPEGET
jgi:phage baseplate assembly protein gpV